VVPRQFDWTDPDALAGPAARRVVRLRADSDEPVAPRLLFLVPEGVRPFALSVQGAKTARVRPETVTAHESDLSLTAGRYVRDELGAFRVADAPPLAAAMDHNKAAYEMTVQREEDLWGLQFPTLHVVGWLVSGSNGHYGGTLEDDGGVKLAVTARVVDGGRAVMLYLTDGPHGSLLFRRRAATQPRRGPERPATLGTEPAPAAP